ncbi:uncharacterized protein LOC128133684 [Lactuca sativa]|uniref:uncharacterized protein LOC128133684 n=1 Tax=Lactuca sativa TaxID=4236 RepID=UPI0022B00A18|nr:uncharacterized protein LOC128133684 [Lactuca sativa]
MEAIMDAHGLWDAIEPPTGVVVDEKKSKQAAKKKTAKEVWDSLKSRYVGAERVQKARLRVLKSEFEALQMKETESIDEYAGKISAMISKFGSAGAILEDEELVRKLFDTVPEKFINLVASMEQSCDMESMPFEEAIGHLKAYEDRLRLRKVHQPTGVQASRTHKVAEEEEEVTTGEEEAAHEDEVRPVAEVVAGAVTHDRRQTLSTKKPRDKSNIRCYECQELGHYASECKAKKQQDQEVNLAADEEEPTLLLTVCGEKNTEMVLLNE